MDYSRMAEQEKDYIIEKRRFFHGAPELSWQEYKTTGAIAAELARLGYQVRTFGDKTGVVAELTGGAAGEGCKTVVLRADIDALPVEEKTGLAYVSCNEGVMHACGHDCHIAMLLGAARLLAETKSELCGRVRLLFQSAEETCGGAEYYMEKGVLDGADAIFGMHIWGTLDAPLFSIERGARMASCDNFTITVKGLSAHATAPHLGIDAIVAASAIVMNLQSFVSRNNDPLNPVVLTVGEFNAGQRFNIIASKAVLKGTARTFDHEFRKKIKSGVENIAKMTAAAYGASAEVEYEMLPPAVVNDDEDLINLARDAVADMYGESAFGSLQPMLGSEDFAFYMEKIPALYCFVGGRNERLGITATNHNDCFTVDEAALPRGSALYARFASDFLKGGRSNN